MKSILSLMKIVRATPAIAIGLSLLLIFMCIVMALILRDSEISKVFSYAFFIIILLGQVYYLVNKSIKRSVNSKEANAKINNLKDFSPNLTITSHDGFSYYEYEFFDSSTLSILCPRRDARPLIYGNYVVVDLETTGLDYIADDIVEIAAVRFENYEPIARWSSLVYPFRKIPREATAVHGISDLDVAHAPQFHQISDSFLQFVGNSPVVGHNFSFDHKFLCRKSIDLSSDKRRVFDTLIFSRKLLKKGDDIENHKLGTLCNHFSIPLNNAHRSVWDCVATGHLFRELVKLHLNI